MGDELAIIDAQTGEILPAVPSTLFGTDNPREVILRAKEHADALADVIKERGLYKVIQGKAYVFVEAWSLLGSQLGVFAVCDSVEAVEIDGVPGFKAAVRAVTRHGEVVGRAEAYCMRDETTWKGRPIHALAGMAETRATSRALRKPLGFIVQLAGYQATGAEEMPGREADVVIEQPVSQHGPAPRSRSAGDPGEASASPPDVPEPLQADEPRASAKSLKKLDVVVTRCRSAGLVTTEQLWTEAGYPTPILDASGEVRYGGEGGLRTRLSQRTVNRMIDWLQDLEAQNAGEPEQVGLSIPAEVKKRMEDRG